LVFFGSISSENLGYRAWDCVCIWVLFSYYIILGVYGTCVDKVMIEDLDMSLFSHSIQSLWTPIHAA